MNAVEERKLREQVEQLASTSRNISSLLMAAEHRNGEMMKLLTTVRRMIESRDGAEVLAGVQEILVSVIGTEQYVIYALGGDDTLVPIAGMGDCYLDARRRSPSRNELALVIRAGRSIVGRVQRHAFPLPDGQEMAACLPLSIIDRVVGAIVIHRLLPHREALDACDEEVLKLLATYAATAIIAAEQRATWSGLSLGNV
ncbi:MAG: hypothetical protein JWO05_1828 [Gemmatimonadetes bacterium]|nr:hypothetical protein [Gemmatimonadota bacterium]